MAKSVHYLSLLIITRATCGGMSLGFFLNETVQLFICTSLTPIEDIESSSVPQPKIRVNSVLKMQEMPFHGGGVGGGGGGGRPTFGTLGCGNNKTNCLRFELKSCVRVKHCPFLNRNSDYVNSLKSKMAKYANNENATLPHTLMLIIWVLDACSVSFTSGFVIFISSSLILILSKPLASLLKQIDACNFFLAEFVSLVNAALCRVCKNI